MGNRGLWVTRSPGSTETNTTKKETLKEGVGEETNHLRTTRKFRTEFMSEKL